MCYGCGSVANYVICCLYKTGCRGWELACLFVFGRSRFLFLVVRRGLLFEVNEEIQNSQLQLCPTIFPFFLPLNLFHSSEPKEYIIVYANTKYKSSVCNFRVEWNLTLCGRQKIIFHETVVVVEGLKVCLYIVNVGFYRILL